MKSFQLGTCLYIEALGTRDCQAEGNLAVTGWMLKHARFRQLVVDSLAVKDAPCAGAWCALRLHLSQVQASERIA